MASPDQDAGVDSSKNQSFASEEEAGPPDGESTPGGEQMTRKKRGKKRKRGAGEGKESKRKNASLSGSPVERPSRERKSVVRYAAAAPRRLSAAKAVIVPQGSGERLKDIPNVNFKFSKRKSDESVRVLHKILFGRKTNVHYLKRNILQFSGFAWSQNEEKERSKVKEKLDKCNKDRLLEFCDLLDIYTLKVTTKKEELSAKILEFLESPHATREEVLSAKDTKRKKSRRDVKRTAEGRLEEAFLDNKRLKKSEKVKVKKDREKPAKADTENLNTGGPIDTDLGSEDKSDDEEAASEHPYSDAEDEDNADEEPESMKTLSDGEEMELQEEPKSIEKSPAAGKMSHVKSKIVRSASASKKSVAQGKAKVLSESKTSMGKKGGSKVKKEKVAVKKDSKDNSTRKVSQKKGEQGSGSVLSSRSNNGKKKEKNNIGTATVDGKESKKQVAKTSPKVKKEKKEIAKTKSKNSTKKGKQDALVGPSREKLLVVVSNILKEVDFDVATLADIITQLGAHFNTDLMHRKTEIKDILEEVINNMTDDEETEEGDGGAEGGDGGAEDGEDGAEDGDGGAEDGEDGAEDGEDGAEE